MEAKHKTEINFAARHIREYPEANLLVQMDDWVLIGALMYRGYQFDNVADPDLLEALKKLARWDDDGLCWCTMRRKEAAENGTKHHSIRCENASSAIAKAEPQESSPTDGPDGKIWTEPPEQA